MSRVGYAVIKLPDTVKLEKLGGGVKVNGPKGSLELKLLPKIDLKLQESEVQLTRKSEDRVTRANHGLMRAMLNNMVQGVSKGFERKLELEGVGYRVAQAGSDLQFSVGYSHPIKFKIPEGVSAQLEQNTITVSGIDKQKVGQVAAEIKAIRKPEPYKGKGIRFVGERLIRKAGKSGKE